MPLHRWTATSKYSPTNMPRSAIYEAPPTIIPAMAHPMNHGTGSRARRRRRRPKIHRPDISLRILRSSRDRDLRDAARTGCASRRVDINVRRPFTRDDRRRIDLRALQCEKFNVIKYRHVFPITRHSRDWRARAV